MDKKYRVKHIKYNRDVVYDKEIEVKAEEFEKLVKENFSEEDCVYFCYHNPACKMEKGQCLHPNARLEQLFKDKNFYIKLV